MTRSDIGVLMWSLTKERVTKETASNAERSTNSRDVEEVKYELVR